MEFKDFLLNENRAHLGLRVGNILDAIQDLVDNAKGMGTRQLVKNSEVVVNHIRKILHTHWPEPEHGFLKRLQKVAVAIMKAVDEKSDLDTIFQSAQAELEAVMSDLKMPINRLATPEKAETPKEEPSPESTAEPQGPPQQPPQPPPGPPTAPPPTATPAPMPAAPMPGIPGMPNQMMMP